MVIDRSEPVYCYILKYRNTPSEPNRFIPQSKAIGNVNQRVRATQKVEDSFGGKHLQLERFERFCGQLINQKKRIQGLFKTSQDITLRVDNILFNRDQLYFVIQIENHSSLAYDLNFLQLSLQTRAKGKRNSLQSLTMEPLYTF